MQEAVNTQTATVAIVPVIGEHDLSGYEPLKAVLARAAIQAPNVIVDLSHCDFIDAAVIGLLLDAHSVVARDAGSFRVARPAEPSAVTRVARAPLPADTKLRLRH
jgi:anti-anti-sigma factor